MIRVGLVLAAFLGGTLLTSPAAAQEPSDVTVAGAVEVAQVQFTPTSGLEIGPGSIQITLTEERDAVLRVELVDLREFSGDGSKQLFVERHHDAAWYYWPPLPIENGEFALEYFLYPDLGFILELPLPTVRIEGEVRSNSELEGTLEFWTTDQETSITTTWTAADQVQTPPGLDDRVFEAVTEAGDRFSFALTEHGSNITALALNELSIGQCFPGETFSVRAFFEPSRSFSQPENPQARVPVDVRVMSDGALRVVRFYLDELEGSTASGTLHWASDEFREDGCAFEVAWQTEPSQEQAPTATASPVSTAEPAALPATGKGTDRGGPLTGLAIMLACLGTGFALLGLRPAAR